MGGSRWSGEQIMKAILGVLLQDEAYEDNVRPPWLSTKEHTVLELDRYYPRLKLAFEFQGEQHYVVVDGMHHDQNQLFSQQRRDAIKRRLCKRKGVTLLYVSRKNISVDYLKTLCVGNVFPSKLAQVVPLWEKSADRLAFLGERAVYYRNRKTKDNQHPPIIEEKRSPVSTKRKSSLKHNPSPYWQDVDGNLIYNTAHPSVAQVEWTCPTCEHTCNRKPNIKIIYCEKCARKEVASKMVRSDGKPVTAARKSDQPPASFEYKRMTAEWDKKRAR